MTRPILAGLAGLVLVLTACAMPPQVPSLQDTLAANDDLESIDAALRALDLYPALEAQGQVTLFAPDDDAFATLLADLGYADLDALVAGLGAAAVTDILLYHVVAGLVTSTSLQDDQVVTTLYGNASLGVSLDAGPQLIDAEGAADITAVDAQANGAVVHTIDRVLSAPGTIVEVATDAGTFDSLLAALTALGLAGSFDEISDGPFTVFAPTDDAFAGLLADLGYADLDALVVGLGADTVTNILLYHVVDGAVGASAAIAAAEAGSEVPTLYANNALELAVDGGLTIENGATDANVTTANVLAANGVIHVVDAVLLPDELR